MFTSLPDELITLVAEKLYVHDGTLANFAAASAACQSAAEDSLLKALQQTDWSGKVWCIPPYIAPERLRELLNSEPCARHRTCLRSPPCARLSPRRRAWLNAACAFEVALQRMAWAVA